MADNKPYRHHYVPQFLLRKFAGADGTLWAYDTETRKRFRTNSNSIAVEGNFYGITLQDGTLELTAIEIEMADKIDGPGNEAIAALLESRLLSTEQAHAFFLFVAAQMQRTPASLQRSEDLFGPIMQEMSDRMSKHDPTFRGNVIGRLKANGATEEELSQMLELLDNAAFTTIPSRDFALGVALRSVGLIATELARMQWTFLRVHPKDGDLIIGDHPVTLTDVASIPGPLGLRNQNIEIAMPLSRRMVAVAHWDGPVSYGELLEGMVVQINDRTMCHSHRFVYASSESEDLLSRAIALRGTGPKMHSRRLRIGKSLIIVNEFR